jgi:hypothetical protein
MAGTANMVSMASTENTATIIIEKEENSYESKRSNGRRTK